MSDRDPEEVETQRALGAEEDDGDRALVGNAADKDQIRKARLTIKRKAVLDAAALRAVLETRDGRDVIWRLLEHCRIHESCYNRDAMAMANLAARQDVGHAVMKWVVELNPEFYFTMMRERA